MVSWTPKRLSISSQSSLEGKEQRFLTTIQVPLVWFRVSPLVLLTAWHAFAEVVKHIGQTLDEFIDFMMSVESFETVDKAYERMFANKKDEVDPNRPEIGMVKQLVDFLDKEKELDRSL